MVWIEWGNPQIVWSLDGRLLVSSDTRAYFFFFSLLLSLRSWSVVISRD